MQFKFQYPGSLVRHLLYGMGIFYLGLASTPALGQDLVASPVNLYFADTTHSRLGVEIRQMVKPSDPSQLGREIINALIRGPQQGLMRTISEATVLRSVFVTEEKIAYLDFEHHISLSHPGGALLELLTIYSITNSLIVNITEIEKVKFLIDGTESETLCGHIDIKYPFKANMALIR
ncbi:MAG: GerMN domain-containing protein [Thermodesulfobacteriota bacterium]